MCEFEQIKKESGYMNKPLLDIKDLNVGFQIDGNFVQILHDVSFSISKGDSCALVGESGSGKSITSKTIMRLLPDPPAKILGGKIVFEDTDLFSLEPSEMYTIRGNRISMIFQEPMTSLNPVFTCGAQIMEPLMIHQHMSKVEAKAKAIEMLRLVGIQLPEKRFSSYPHELSGGMRQRVMIAIALSCSPSLLIADEPTTALDPTIQAQILALIKELKDKIGMSLLLVTHDLGMVAGACTHVVVMYAGTVVERAEVDQLFKNPQHPYTRGLLRSVPKINNRVDMLHTIEGVVPSFTALPQGCPFSPRCSQRMPICSQKRPPLFNVKANHDARCWLIGGVE
jgi:oligopeptide/dipeptide ABC transporter ATP-binding protein